MLRSTGAGTGRANQAPGYAWCARMSDSYGRGHNDLFIFPAYITFNKRTQRIRNVGLCCLEGLDQLSTEDASDMEGVSLTLTPRVMYSPHSELVFDVSYREGYGKVA